MDILLDSARLQSMQWVINAAYVQQALQSEVQYFRYFKGCHINIY
jgi:hypothetical protein